MTFARPFTSLLLAAAALPAPLLAQPADAPDAEEIVVTGYQLQNREAVLAKRDNPRIGEFLSSDEIGQLPDYNISDSFRRLPGVTTVFDEDEGRYVGVRGLNPNFTFGTFDGALLATAERGNRQINMESIPTTAVARLEVLKSRTPDIEGNAIGGVVNLITRSAFDQPGLFAVGSAFVGLSDATRVPGRGFGRSSDDGVNFRFDGTVATQFGPDDQFGIVLTGAYSRKRRDQERVLPQGYTVTNGVPVATGILLNTYPNSVDRYGGTAKLEWRPSPELHAFVAGTYFEQADNELRHSQQLTRGAVDAAGTSGATARVSTAGGFLRFNDFPIRKPLYVVNGRVDYDGEDGHRFGVRGSWSKATFLEPSNQLQFNLPTTAANAYTQTSADGVPFATLTNPATYNNPASYIFASFTPYRDDSTDFVREGQLDWSYNGGPDDAGFGLASGAKYRSITRDFDTQQAVYGPATGLSLSAAQFILPVTYEPILTGGQSRPQPFIDFAAFERYRAANPTQIVLNTAATALNAQRNDYVVDEKVMGAYLSGQFRNDFVQVIAGVRYEDTETTVSGFRVNAAVLTPQQRRGDYRDWLPSVLATFDLSEQVKLRASYYRAIGRPNPSDLGTNETLNQAAGTLTRGNPDLQPRRADNYDLSLEYYFPRALGAVSLAVFHKDIGNDIFAANAGTTVIDGTTYTVTQAQNLTGSRITGVEAAVVVNSLDFLPGALKGFGFSANATYLDAKANFPGGLSFDRLTLQPEWQGNAAIFYQLGGFQARASYAYIGRQFTAISPATPLANRFDRPFETVDAQARIRLGPVDVIAEARNLTDSHRENYDGLGARDLNYFGRQFWLGVAVGLGGRR